MFKISLLLKGKNYRWIYCDLWCVYNGCNSEIYFLTCSMLARCSNLDARARSILELCKKCCVLLYGFVSCQLDSLLSGPAFSDSIKQIPKYFWPISTHMYVSILHMSSQSETSHFYVIVKICWTFFPSDIPCLPTWVNVKLPEFNCFNQGHST